MSEWDVTQTSNNQELYNNYVSKHPECRLMSSEAIWTQMKHEGLITDSQYSSGLKISVFNTNGSFIDSPLVSFSSSTNPIEQPPIPYAPLKYHSSAKDIVINSQGKVDKSQYSLEVLKKQFNEKDYEYKTENEDNLGYTGYTRTTLTIVSKKTQKPVLEVVTNSESNSYSVTKYDKQTKTSYSINNDGYLIEKREKTDANNFRVTEYQENASMLPKEHMEFKNGEMVLSIIYDINGKTLEKSEYRDGGRVETKYQNGHPIKTEYYGGAKEKHNLDVVEYTANSIYKGLYLWGSCSDEQLSKYLTDITSDNIDDLERTFKEKTGKHLSDAIVKINNNTLPFLRSDKLKTLLNHLEKCWEKHYGYVENYRNDNADVKNEWHIGDPYSVAQDGDNLIAVNQKTGLTSIINLEEYLQNFDLNEKAKMKSLIQKLPGEVIEDLAVEMHHLDGKNTLEERFIDRPLEKIANLTGISDFERGGYYDPLFDAITIKNIDTRTIVHELGHAVDHCRLSYQTDFDQQFDKVFDKEMEIYKQKGNKTFSYHKSNGAAYCTANKKEMFAECYTLLMTGEDKSKDCILEHFPETLNVVRQMIIEQRKSDNRRL